MISWYSCLEKDIFRKKIIIIFWPQYFIVLSENNTCLELFREPLIQLDKIDATKIFPICLWYSGDTSVPAGYS